MSNHNRIIAVLSIASVLTISACGGGGGSDTGNSTTLAQVVDLSTPSVITPSGNVQPQTLAPSFTLEPAKLFAKYTSGSNRIISMKVIALNAGQIDNDVYAIVIDNNGILARNPNSTEITASSVTFDFFLSDRLPVGRYQDKLIVRLCRDGLCQKEYSGSPLTIPYDITIESFVGGSTVCPSVTNSVPVTSGGILVLGACEVYENPATPTRSASAFQSVGNISPVTYSPTLGYTIRFPSSATATTLPLNNLLAISSGSGPSLGNYAGKTYQTIIDGTSGAAATIYDYRNTLTQTSSKVLDLNHSRFGVFSQFSDRYQGYYGGWSNVGDNGAAPLNIIASTTFRGVVVGVLAPGMNNTGLATAAGFSADLLITIDPTKAADQVTSVVLSNFGYSSSRAPLPSQRLTSGGLVASGSTLDLLSKRISASFSTPDSTSTNGINFGVLNGTMAGASNAAANELVGSIQFTTSDGSNGIASFGARSGLSLVNP
jgi:hypothetical protein